MEQGHDHHHHAGSGRIGTAFFLNLFFSLFEIAGGIITGSTALISDAVHDLGDAVTLGASWFMEKFSHKKHDSSYTFGYRRFSLLASLIHVLILLAGSAFIFYRAIPALFDPPDVHVDGMLIFAAVGVTVNLIAVLRLRKGHSSHEKMITLHLLEDMLGWIALLAVSLIIKVWYLPILDPILAIAIALFLLVTVLLQAKEVFTIFLQAVPPHLDTEQISREIADTFPEVSQIHDLHIWSLDGEQTITSFHMVTDGERSLADVADLKQKIKEYLEQKHDLRHVTIDAETDSDSCVSLH